MPAVIEIMGLTKHFKVLNRREGLLGAVRDLFSTDYRLVKAVNAIDMTIHEGELWVLPAPMAQASKRLSK